MYRTFEEEGFLAPETIISDVLFADTAGEEFDDAVFDIAADLRGGRAGEVAFDPASGPHDGARERGQSGTAEGGARRPRRRAAAGMLAGI